MRKLIYLTLLLSAPQIANAQNCNDISDSTKRGEAMINSESNIFNSGDVNTPIAASKSSAQISASNEGSVASLKLANKITSKYVPKNDCSFSGKFKSKSWDITLSAPLDKKNNTPTKVATLNGLASGMSAGFSFSTGYTFGIEEAKAAGFNDAIQALNLAIENCVANPSTNADTCRAMTIDNDDVEKFLVFWLGSERFEDQFESDARTLWFTGKGKVGYDEFDYIDPTNLSTQSETGTTYSAVVSVTYAKYKQGIAMTLGGKYQSAFDQTKEQINCLTDMGEIKCAAGRPMEPSRSDSLLAFGEIRKSFDLQSSIMPRVGFAPRITHDFDKDVTGVSVPIYLVPTDGGLSSGLQLGWRSDTDKVMAGIFVGGSFDLFN